MNVRFRFKNAGLAASVMEKLPCDCVARIVRDLTADVYLEVPENYEDYIERYLYTPYREQL